MGEGFKGDNEANAAMAVIAEEFGLRESPDVHDPDDVDDFTLGRALE